MLDYLSLSSILKQMLNNSSLDRIFYALSDPTRRDIVERLSKKPASVSELASPLDMSMAAVVQHVQILEESGLIKTQKIGRVRSCRVEPNSLELIENWVHQRRKFWERNLDRLGEFLEKTEKGKK
ncbi:DNA-binding helix-turn-helix protein [Leptospira johnsonii]|uniref:DNA-binding helix-turn-helix protein n=2 Tax=Leptospira johnsonii TaxID=1917820 RepID=A0A2P2CXB4_9LEPT|nr:DNA-binding helix-turn-helix protein [Leptospira johnsonii]